MHTYKCFNCGKEVKRKSKFYGSNFICHSCAAKSFWSNEENRRNAILKRESTNLKKYGYKEAAMSPEVKEKQRITRQEKGIINPFTIPEKLEKIQKLAHSKESMEKKKETNRKKFGVEWPAQSFEVLEKMKNTYFEKTGYKSAMHNPEVQQKNRIKAYLYDNIQFDSSWELAFYIYLKDHNKSFIYHPPFYMDYIDEEGVSRIYKPDFLVEGKFIEIKGEQFFDKDGHPFNNYTKKSWQTKFNKLVENKVEILRVDDIKKYLRYIKEKYGNKYLKQFKITKEGSETIEKVKTE